VAWLAASAVTLAPTAPGQVKALLAGSPAETSVAIDGPVSFADLKYLASLDNLRSLDLSKAEIKIYRSGAEYYPENVIPTGVFAGAKLTQFKFPTTDRLVVEDAAFAGSAIEEIYIPETVASIGEGAFAGSAVKSVTLNGKTGFGQSVFADCTNLDNANLGGLAELPAHFFAGCTSLKSVVATEDLSIIGDRAFRGASSLASFEFGPALKSVGTEAFAGAGLETADLSRSSALVALAPRAFADNANLRYAAFGPAMKDLGEGVFFGCPALAKVDASVTEIPDYAYVNDTSLDITTVYTPDIASIGAFSLKGLEQVVQLNLYPALAYIGDNAMQDITGLESIDAREMTAVPQLGENVWENVSQELVKLYAMDEMADMFEASPQWQDFDIVKLSSIIAIDTDAESSVEARFEGSELDIRSRHEAMSDILLYDASGIMLTHLTPASETAKIETSQWGTRIYIVCVTLADGTHATAKLIRK